MKIASSVAVVFAGLSALVSTASAADFCITSDAGLFVARGFKPPNPGKCKSFTKGTYFANISGIALGAACTNSAGDTLRVTWAFDDEAGISYHGRFDIPYPSLSGGTVTYTQAADPNTVISSTGVVTSAAPCATPVPID